MKIWQVCFVTGILLSGPYFPLIPGSQQRLSKRTLRIAIFGSQQRLPKRMLRIAIFFNNDCIVKIAMSRAWDLAKKRIYIYRNVKI